MQRLLLYNQCLKSTIIHNKNRDVAKGPNLSPHLYIKEKNKKPHENMTIKEYLEGLFESKMYLKFYELFGDRFGFSLEDDYSQFEKKVNYFVETADIEFFCLEENLEDTVDKFFIIPMLKNMSDISYIRKFFDYESYKQMLIDRGYTIEDNYVFSPF